MDIPVSLVVHLAQTPHAMRIFSEFGEAKQLSIINAAHRAKTKEEMDDIIKSITRYNLQ